MAASTSNNEENLSKCHKYTFCYKKIKQKSNKSALNMNAERPMATLLPIQYKIDKKEVSALWSVSTFEST